MAESTARPDERASQECAQTREIDRAPRKLMIYVDLLETPMASEAGALVTRHVAFDTAVADEGALGAAIRVLTAGSLND